MSDNQPHVMYYTDGQGNWERVEWKPQCQHDVLMAGQCQGTEGHAGDHWAYDLAGHYCYDLREPTKDVAAGSIPPDHEDYIDPRTMAPKHHVRFSEHTVITDPELIARLERGETGPNESINRPLTDEEAEELGLFTDEEDEELGL